MKNMTIIVLIDFVTKLFLTIMLNFLCYTGYCIDEETIGNILLISGVQSIYVFVFEDNNEKAEHPYVTFIDLKVAFDTVVRNIIWERLKGLKVPNNIMQVVKCEYSKVQSRIHLNGRKSVAFEINERIRQEDSLSPL